jgi:hypothetical protein
VEARSFILARWNRRTSQILDRFSNLKVRVVQILWLDLPISCNRRFVITRSTLSFRGV